MIKPKQWPGHRCYRLINYLYMSLPTPHHLATVTNTHKPSLVNNGILPERYEIAIQQTSLYC